MKKISIITLGCKVNKNESDNMAYLLGMQGYLVTDQLEKADYYIVNSCAVTNEGEKKSRQVVSKILKLNSLAKIMFCGCASENNAKQFKDKDNVVMVIGTKNKEQLVDYILNLDNKVKSDDAHFYNVLESSQRKKPHITNTRAYLKIQDGCNRFCSYCIIPYLRGRSVSRDINEIVDEAQQLAKRSHEIVLVGIDISDFKVNDKLALPLLVEKLSAVHSRFRFGSFEVNAISDELLASMKSAKNFVDHFHLSLQSGDDDVLKNMNRKYTTDEYYAKCKLIRSYFPNANITTDIIVGFPTETEEQFKNTIEFCKKVGFGRMHIFPFSVRGGTPASKLADLPKKVKQYRYQKLSKVGEGLSAQYYKSEIGNKRTLLLETESENHFVGYTENYIKTYIKKSNSYSSGETINITLIKTYKDGMKAEEIK